MRIGSSIQFTAGRDDCEKECQVWIYPTDNGDCLAPVQLYNGYIRVPILSDYMYSDMYVISCLESLITAIKTQAIDGNKVALEELMLAFYERKIE
jgi:hypothetical protein